MAEDTIVDPVAPTSEPSGSSSAAPVGTQDVQPGQQPSSQESRTSATSGFTYKEDRSRWMPPHRLAEETQKRQAIEAQLVERDRKIAALAGIQPTDPKSEKANQVKDAFLQMFPQFKRLVSMTDEQMEALVKTPESVNRAAEVENREWARHGKAQMSALYESVAEAIGADKLNADQQNDLRDSFKSWFKGKVAAESEASGGESSATLQRYEDADPTLLQDFVKRYTANWIEPARRRATQQQITRTRAVPNSQGRSQVTSVPASLTGKSLDERLDYAAGQIFGK